LQSCSVKAYRLKHFHALAMEAGLTALVEVHDEAELDRALAVDARLIGVNNRDLKNFHVDLAATERLAGRLRSLPDAGEVVLVAESGIHTRADVDRLSECGAGAILVGESLVRHGVAEIGGKIGELLG